MSGVATLTSDGTKSWTYLALALGILVVVILVLIATGTVEVFPA